MARGTLAAQHRRDEISRDPRRERCADFRDSAAA